VSRWLHRFWDWLNKRFNIVANEEDSKRYSAVDDELRRKGQ